MKLLFCPDCWDMFKLEKEMRSCTCGKCKGRYIDDMNVEIENGIPFGLDNSWLYHVTKFNDVTWEGKIWRIDEERCDSVKRKCSE